MADRVEAEVRELLETVPGADPIPGETVARLGRMLQGFELYLHSDDEPYLELYHAAVGQRSLGEMARVAAALLQGWLAGNWKPRLRERAHFNLLGLCSEIVDRKRFSGPLWELYRRRLVSGEYYALQPIPLVRALLDAMIRNQPEGFEPKALWQNLLDGISDGYLEGGPLDGFFGMLYLPESGSDGDRVGLLAECLLTLFWMDEERIFLSALSAMRRVEPALAERVDKRTRFKIGRDFRLLVKERQTAVVEPAMRRLQKEGQQEVACEVASKWEKICRTFNDSLTLLEGSRRPRTKIQIFDLYVTLINREFYSIEASPFRAILMQLRKFDTAKRPNPSRPDESSSAKTTEISPSSEEDLDLAGLYAGR